MCKKNFIHVCFIIDESGSMSGSESDIIGGFNKTIKEQKEIKDGECAVSFFSFNDNVQERFIGKDVSDIKLLTRGNLFRNKFTSVTTNKGDINSVTNRVDINSVFIDGTYNIDIKCDRTETNPLYEYTPYGSTAMNDGIGTAIDRIGKWLSEMPEEERPSKNLIVIMTDGEENSSKEYSLSKVQEMIKHQTEKYNWTFVYMGMDITNKKAADDLGITSRSFVSKNSDSLYKNYHNISTSAACYRCCSIDPTTAHATMDSYLNEELKNDTILYEKQTGIKID